MLNVYVSLRNPLIVPWRLGLFHHRKNDHRLGNDHHVCCHHCLHIHWRGLVFDNDSASLNRLPHEGVRR